MFSDSELAGLEATTLAALKDVPDEEFTMRRVRACNKPKEKLPPLAQLPGAGGALLAYRNGTRGAAVAWARTFTIGFLHEIRHAICAKGSSSAAGQAGGLTAKSAASAIAAWLSQAFTISSPMAIGIATLVILVIATAAKSAFCAMTDEEIVRNLRRAEGS